MSPFLPQWFKQIFIHQALSSDRCTIVGRPSTMSDADAMQCEGNPSEHRQSQSRDSTDFTTAKKDTIVIDRFQACFIDCTCQCEARKVIPQSSSTSCHGLKSQLFDELFQQIRGSSYEIDCCCDCGAKGSRQLKFAYATGDKTIT